MKNGKMVLPNHKKNDTLLKAQLKTCSIWKKAVQYREYMIETVREVG